MSSTTASPETGSKASFATDSTATADRGRQQQQQPHQPQQQQHHRRDSRSPSQSRFKSTMTGIVEKVKAAVHGDSSSGPFSSGARRYDER